MDFDLSKEEVSEDEIDALGIKKKDNALVDVDLPEDDTAVPPELEDGEVEEADKGIFGDDPELEAYMLGEENY